MCQQCGLIEARWNDAEDYEEFTRRWNDANEISWDEVKDAVEERQQLYEQQAREWSWPAEGSVGLWQVTNREGRAAKLAEHFETQEYSVTKTVDDHLEFEYVKRLPSNAAMFAQIVDEPDDATLRHEFARWMRMQSDPRAREVSEFIEAQLRLAAAAGGNQREEILRAHRSVFASEGRFADRWWRYPRTKELQEALCDNLYALRLEGLVDDLRWYRGFVEHVAIKASRFLEVADELYSLAPIRHLTITYAKGLDHQDRGLWSALLQSPYLERIRSIRLPLSVLSNEYTELNRLDDEDIELLATSSRLRGLRYLDLEDQRRLTIRSFDALASSASLTELSAVQHDLYNYEYVGAFSFGNVGPRTRTLARRPLDGYSKELEARHGHIVWLHSAEYYGTDVPEPEVVVEHPAALSAAWSPR